MKIKLNIIMVLFFSFFFSCSSNICDIEKLDKAKIDFDKLPQLVKDTLLELSKPKHYFEDKADLLNLDGNYKLKIKKIGPWIDYLLIIDATNNEKYKLKRGLGKPFVIYDSHLYISDDLNMLVVNNIRKLKFTDYKLK
jgi:hypothetical protein